MSEFENSIKPGVATESAGVKRERERELNEKVGRWYAEWVDHTKRHYHYDLNIAEAVYLRKLIKDIFIANDSIVGEASMDYTVTWTEITTRFLMDLYGINIIHDEKWVNVSLEEVFSMVKRKYRPEQEMI